MSPRLQSLYERSPIFLQNALVSLYGLKTRRERMDAGFDAALRRLLAAERDPPERQRAAQAERLRAVLAHAHATVPYYRRAMTERGLRPEDVRTIEDLRKLPVLGREDVRRHFDDLVSTAARRRDLRLGHTSGTTGSPLELWWDRGVSLWNNLLLHRARAWAGYRFGDRTATLLGNVIVPLRQQRPPFWRRCRPWNKVFFSSFHLDRRHLPAYVAELRRLSPVWLEAYPSTAYVLAQFLEETDDVLPLRGVFLSSEPLLPAMREAIERRFATRAWDAYSMSERVVFSAECEVHRGQHLFPELGIVEVLDERDRPVPPGEPGRIVATGLRNLAMPLVRYDTGDVGGLDPAPCPCGRTLPRMLPVTTKAEDIVVTPEGRLVPPSVLTHPFKPMHGIVKSQIVQESPDRVVVRLVVRPGEWNAGLARELRDGLAARLGPSVALGLELVDDIPRSAAGKYRWVVSNVPLGLGGAARRNLYGSGAP